MKTVVFKIERQDFVDSLQWVLKSTATKDSVEWTFDGTNTTFSIRDRSAFFSSVPQTMELTGGKVSDFSDGDDSFTLSLDRDSLSRFSSVIPKRASDVELEIVVGESDVPLCVTARAGRTKTSIPCYVGKVSTVGKTVPIARVDLDTFYTAFSSVRSASRTESGTENAMTCVDVSFALNADPTKSFSKAGDDSGNSQPGDDFEDFEDFGEEHLDEDSAPEGSPELGDAMGSAFNGSMRLFGTDSFVMSRCFVPVVISDPSTFGSKLSDRRYLVSSHYANLKNIQSLTSGAESATFITNPGKKTSWLGLRFDNGNVCIFTCIDAEPIAAADPIFQKASDNAENNFTLPTSALKSAFKNIMLLGNDSETTKVIMSEGSARFMDEHEFSSLSVDGELETKEASDDKEDEGLYPVTFSNIVVKKFLNCIPFSTCSIGFPSTAPAMVFVTQGVVGENEADNGKKRAKFTGSAVENINVEIVVALKR